MAYDEFESELGKVAVSKKHVERQKSYSEEWEKIRDIFDEEELVQNIRFSDISYFEFRHGEKYPNIKIKTDDGELKRLFFLNGETAEDCFESIKYRFHVFKQNYQ